MDRIVILGAAESGVGAAILAKQKGFDVFVSDMGAIKDKYKTQLDAHGIAWEEGQHTEEKILNAKEIIKSPGIPREAPMVQKAMNHGIGVVSEIEFAARYTNAKMVCITGSNGKTTTTSLIYHIFKTAGYNVGLGGNIGRSLALQVAEGAHDWYVIELSSFQLEDMFQFKAHIAVLLNITPDHLDRYNYQMQGYVDAKMRILQNLTPQDYFIYWADDPVVKPELQKYNVPAKVFAFAEHPETGAEAYVEDGDIKLPESLNFNMPQAQLSLPGKHNLYNSLAAALAARAAGIPQNVVQQGLSDFPGVEHRMERVATMHGVNYINRYALEAMTPPTVLIIGGKDKGNDYEPIKQLVKEKCAALVYLGADNTKLHQNFDHLGLPVADTNSMKQCVEACANMAKEGYTVLLSPCCASFDLFKNMEDRGEQFKTLVRNL